MGKKYKSSTSSDSSSLGLNCLAFVCSILGFVLFFVLLKSHPRKARGCLIWSIVGGVFTAVLIKACLF